MSINLQYLVPLWGFSGAREKFEEMCGQLIKNEYPASERIRVHRGDGGIDAHVGALTSVEGIHVFQVKFFDDGLGDSQKQQIRESFQTAATSKSYKARAWTLCLPLNLSIPEKTWFETWKVSQAASGIEIEPIWDETRLVNLLLQEKNKGIRETFFRQEHLALARESNAYLRQIAERTPKPEPISLRAKIVRVSVGSVERYQEGLGRINVRLNFEVTNTGNKAAKEWDVDFEVLSDNEKLQERLSVPRGDHAVNTVLPNRTGQKMAFFTFEIARRPPVQLQLGNELYKTRIRFRTISEEGLGEYEEVSFQEVLEDGNQFCDVVMNQVRNTLGWT